MANSTVGVKLVVLDFDLTMTVVHMSSKLGAIIHAYDITGPPVQAHMRALEHYRKDRSVVDGFGSRARLEDLRAAFLQLIKGRSMDVVVVTQGFTKVVREILTEVKIDIPVWGVDEWHAFAPEGGDHPTKEDVVLGLCRRHGVEGHNCIMFDDDLSNLMAPRMNHSYQTVWVSDFNTFPTMLLNLASSAMPQFSDDYRRELSHHEVMDLEGKSEVFDYLRQHGPAVTVTQWVAQLNSPIGWIQERLEGYSIVPMSKSGLALLYTDHAAHDRLASIFRDQVRQNYVPQPILVPDAPKDAAEAPAASRPDDGDGMTEEEALRAAVEAMVPPSSRPSNESTSHRQNTHADPDPSLPLAERQAQLERTMDQSELEGGPTAALIQARLEQQQLAEVMALSEHEARLGSVAAAPAGHRDSTEDAEVLEAIRRSEAAANEDPSITREVVEEQQVAEVLVRSETENTAPPPEIEAALRASLAEQDDEAAEMERIMELSKQEVDDEAFQRQREEEQLRLVMEQSLYDQ